MLKKKCNSFMLLFLAEILFILILIPGCFRKEQMVECFWGEDIRNLMTVETGHKVFRGSKITLNPGVYQIRVWSAVTEGQSMYVQMLCDNSTYKALRNNGVTFFAESVYDDFEVYVLNTIETAYVHCDFYNTDASGLVRLEVWKTNMGNKILLFIAIAFFGVLDFLICFRRGIISGRITKKQQIVFWAMTAGVLLAYFPYLTDFFYFGDDGIFHVSRISFLKDTIQQNGFWPAWIQSSWAYGHGFASSVFYCDFFLLFPAFLQMLGFSAMAAYKIFIFGITAATGMISYFCFYRCVRDEYAALLGSLFYLLVPYRLLDVYGRGALGETLAMTFLPLVCCGMYLLFTEDTSSEKYSKNKWYIVWGMSAILLSHLVTTVMASVFIAFICVGCWKRTFRRKTFVQLLETVGLVLLICAWFWMPMLYMMNIDKYHVEPLQVTFWPESGITISKLFQMTPNTGGIQIGEFSGKPLHLGAGAIIFTLLFIFYEWNFKKRNAVCETLFVLTAVACLLSTKYLPWDRILNIPIIGSIMGTTQFPFRWLSIASVMMAMVIAFFCRWVRGEKIRIIKIGVYIGGAVIISSAIYHVNDIAFVSSPTWLYNVENMGTVGVSSGEYLLRETERVSDVYYHKPVMDDGLTYSSYEKAGTNIVITIQNQAEDEQFMELPLFGYKGYEIKELDTNEKMSESPYISDTRGEHGDLRIAVPGGYQGTLKVYYQGFPIFYIAEAVSVIGIAIIVGMHLCRVFRDRKILYKKRVPV